VLYPIFQQGLHRPVHLVVRKSRLETESYASFKKQLLHFFAKLDGEMKQFG